MLFFVSFRPILAEDNIDQIATQFPIVIANYSSLIGPEKHNKITWSRTDMLNSFSVNQLNCKDTQLLIGGNLVVFLSPEKSGQAWSDYWASKKAGFSLVIHKWEFEIEKEGNFLITSPSDLGAIGYLNKNRVVLINNGTLSKKDSGQQWVPLLKGKNDLYLAVTAREGIIIPIKITAEADMDQIKNEIRKKLNSTKKEDMDWVAADFLPYLATIGGSFPQIISELERINKLRTFSKNEESRALLGSFIGQNKNYAIEKYICANFSEIYFYISEQTNQKNKNAFLQQLIYDGQKTLAENYLNQSVKSVNENKGIPDKEKYISDLYSTQFVSFFKMGRFKEANEILNITKEKCKPFPLPNCINGIGGQENTVTLTQSFDETAAFQVKESLESYVGSPEHLATLYKTFLGLTNNLVKKDDGAVSLYYYFQLFKNANSKLKNDFEILDE